MYGEDQNLFEKLSSSQQKASYDLDIRNNRKRAKRKAKMSLKYEKVKIKHPKNRPLENRPSYIEMWAIETKEISTSVPSKEDPILWRLLTTHPIECTLKNPYENSSLQWASWAMGRLGGWSGYQSQGPPISIKNGTDRFYDKADGFLMALEYFLKKDVYKG